jgi:hypothetical protein
MVRTRHYLRRNRAQPRQRPGLGTGGSGCARHSDLTAASRPGRSPGWPLTAPAAPPSRSRRTTHTYLLCGRYSSGQQPCDPCRDTSQRPRLLPDRPALFERPGQTTNASAPEPAAGTGSRPRRSRSRRKRSRGLAPARAHVAELARAGSRASWSLDLPRNVAIGGAVPRRRLPEASGECLRMLRLFQILRLTTRRHCEREGDRDQAGAS